MKSLFFILLAYFLGSVPAGVWVGKYFKNIDIREHGSKNTGTTNAWRVLGARYGVLVLFIDALKGWLPPFLASKAGVSGNILVFIGMVAILGHTLSCFLRFKGGKGVATSLGTFLFLIPKVTLILLVLFIVIVALSKYISLGSIVCAGLLPILTLLFPPTKSGMTRGPIFVITLFTGIFVIWKHRSNIARLRSGSENKFKF
ncbi:MAG: glycerol-3-phosphate 1-O-acyltransferase PlsY [Fusobacteriaceae bacterium]|jgi:glycerol-3-phosphate acyltransferase PlsY|nr:glycerol-3-phosphate 1-O-acyltransferase PlsY [Fusobacteriaceae bacterium]